MAIQVQSAYNAFSRYKRDITDVSTSTFLDWADWLNKFVYRKLVGVEPDRYISSQSYTVTTSPYASSLPTGFKTLDGFKLGLFLVNADGTDTDIQLAVTGFGSTQPGYYLTSSSIVFTGITNETYKMRYLPAITAIDALTDYFTLETTQAGKVLIPDDQMDFVVKALDVFYNQWDEDVGMEGNADQRFERLLSDFPNDMKRVPNVYGLTYPSY